MVDIVSDLKCVFCYTYNTFWNILKSRFFLLFRLTMFSNITTVLWNLKHLSIFTSSPEISSKFKLFLSKHIKNFIGRAVIYYQALTIWLHCNKCSRLSEIVYKIVPYTSWIKTFVQKNSFKYRYLNWPITFMVLNKINEVEEL